LSVDIQRIDYSDCDLGVYVNEQQIYGFADLNRRPLEINRKRFLGSIGTVGVLSPR